jgi:starch phosphorylase
MSVRAFVALGDLAPADVDVQLVHGRSTGEDELVDTAVESLVLAESYEAGRHRFDGDIVLDHSGSFGYTVRIIPRNDLLISPAELGIVALP